MKNLKKEISIALDAVRSACGLTAAVQESHSTEVRIKKDISPVTVADYAAQALICRAILNNFPEDRILAEEHVSADMDDGGFFDRLQALVETEIGRETDRNEMTGWINHRGEPTAKRCWIIDPVDGTKGFLRGGQYCIALALMVNDRVEIGFLGCPNLSYDAQNKGCLFFAGRGGGAFQYRLDNSDENKPVSVSKKGSPGDARFVESVESAHTDHGFHDALSHALGITRPALRIDSQVKYAMVARGDAQVYVRMQSKSDPARKQKVWDHAAGALLVKEAGGQVTDTTGAVLDFSCGSNMENNMGILATNGAFHERIVEEIARLSRM